MEQHRELQQFVFARHCYFTSSKFLGPRHSTPRARVSFQSQWIVELSRQRAEHWNGRVVFEKGRVKRFETEREAWEFLARCDLVGKIIH